jgi:hypothetical protein
LRLRKIKDEGRLGVLFYPLFILLEKILILGKGKVSQSQTKLSS